MKRVNSKTLEVMGKSGATFDDATMEAIALETQRLLREEQGLVKSTFEDNKGMALGAAQVVAGDVVLDRLVKLAEERANPMVAGYVGTPVGKIALANALNFAIKQYMPTNTKALYIADAVMQSAYIELGQSFDVPSMIDDLLDGVSIPGMGTEAK